MSDLRAAAQQALEALEQDNPAGRSATIIALRAVLEQPAQEPVAYVTTNEDGDYSMLFFDRDEALTYCHDDEEPIALYAAQAVAAEREACADICDQHASAEGIAQRCAAAIRARGQKESPPV